VIVAQIILSSLAKSGFFQIIFGLVRSGCVPNNYQDLARSDYVLNNILIFG